MSDPIALIPPRVPFLDPRTGDISRQWFLLFAAIVNRLGSAEGMSVDDLALGTLTGNALPNLEALLLKFADASNMRPSVVPTFNEQVTTELNPTLASYAPVDDVSPIVYVGSMGTQNAEKVAITGGAIDGTVIGAATAAAGKFTTVTSAGGATFMATSAALTNGAGALLGTIATSPVAGPPSKWIGINDNGTVRYIPAW